MDQPEDKSPWLDPVSVAPRRGSGYPPPFAVQVAGRESALLATLSVSPSSASISSRFPRAPGPRSGTGTSREDEFIYVLEGEVTLVTDAGEKVLGPDMAAGFPAGKADGHHLINRSDKPVRYLEVGTRAESEVAHYSDVDMVARKENGRFVFTRKNGEPCP